MVTDLSPSGGDPRIDISVAAAAAFAISGNTLVRWRELPASLHDERIGPLTRRAGDEACEAKSVWACRFEQTP